MRNIWISIGLCLLVIELTGQSVNVEHPKDVDYSQFKTFSFGKSEIMLSKEEQKISNNTLNAWVVNSITKELTNKGLVAVDSAGDLTITYLMRSVERTDSENLGPLGGTPGSNTQTWSRDYDQNSLIIDLQNRNTNLVWRVNAETNNSPEDYEETIGKIVYEGFRKFESTPSKHKKRKKKS